MFTVDDYAEALHKYNKYHKLTNDFLYDLCNKETVLLSDKIIYTNRQILTAQIYIIGRTYASGIERTIRTDGHQGNAMAQLIDYLIPKDKSSGGYDDMVKLISCVQSKQVESEEKRMEIAVTAHRDFIELLSRITNRVPRSFASKFLHFHCPDIFPIYDRYALSALVKLVHLRGIPRIIIADADDEYANFCSRYMQIAKTVKAALEALKKKDKDKLFKEIDYEPNTRNLDYYLCFCANKYLNPNN